MSMSLQEPNQNPVDVVPTQQSESRDRSERREPGQDGGQDIDEHLVSLFAPSSYEAEQYRTLAHMIELMHKDTGLQVLAVTSPTPGDGKTTTAINLAGALAQTPGARVLLMCADLRRPSVIEHLGMAHPHPVGLATAILNPGQTLTEVVEHLGVYNLSILPVGPGLANPHEALKTPRLGELFQQARQHYEYIVVDTPPRLLVPDSHIIEKWVDGFLMVVGARKTPRSRVEEAVNLMDPSKLVGLVFNYDDHHMDDYHYYNYLYPHGRPESLQRQSWWRRLARRLPPSATSYIARSRILTLGGSGV
jgi:capsular exopolysaccharide synthesis family protein